mgnify:CR=1 FL=1
MKRILVALAILACLGFTASNTEPPPRVLITGRIINASTGSPVTQATVVVENSTQASDAAQTNDEGRFFLSVGSTAGPIQLIIAQPCFHQVRIQLSGQPLDGRRQVDVGLPPDNEIYGRNSPPLGGCETR